MLFQENSVEGSLYVLFDILAYFWSLGLTKALLWFLENIYLNQLMLSDNRLLLINKYTLPEWSGPLLYKLSLKRIHNSVQFIAELNPIQNAVKSV